MLIRKLFVPAQDTETLAPSILRRVRGEESGVSGDRLQDWDWVPPDMKEDWWKIRMGVCSADQRLPFLRKLATTLTAKCEPSPAFTQIVLTSIKDTFLTPSSSATLFDLFQLCAAREKSRLCLSAATAEVIIGCYSRNLATFRETPTEDNCQVFFYCAQGLFALGLLALIHENDSPAIGRIKEEAAVWLQAGVMAVATEPQLRSFSESEYAYLSERKELTEPFRVSYPHVDLSLVLLSHLCTLAQTSSNLPAIVSSILPSVLSSLQTGFKTAEAPHSLSCLFDRTTLVLELLTVEFRRMKHAALHAITDNRKRLSEVTMTYLYTDVQKRKLLTESERGNVLSLLEVIWGECVGSQEEQLPLLWLQPVEDWVDIEESDDLVTQLLALLTHYLAHFSPAKAGVLVLNSGLLSVLLSPFFLLQTNPIDLQPLQLSLKSREGRAQFLQEFVKGFQRHKDNFTYASKLSALLCELVAEESDWTELLCEQHLMDYLYQVLLETELQPLQVCVASLLRQTQLAGSLLEQPNVLKTAHCFIGSDFGLELWARLLSSNSSVQAFHTFTKLLNKEQNESCVQKLFHTIETALGGADRTRTQMLFLQHSIFKVGIKRMADFPGLVCVALPAFRRLLYRCVPAQTVLRTMELEQFKSVLREKLDSLKLPEEVADLESMLENVLYILQDSSDLRTDALLQVRLPELADLAMSAILRLSEEAQIRYIPLLHHLSLQPLNALLLSNGGAIQPTLRLLSLTPNTSLWELTLEMLTNMMRETLRPCDLTAFIQCLNDDSKASYPTSLTTTFLALLQQTFDSTTETSHFFHLFPGGSIKVNVTFPRKKGSTVFVWFQLSPPPSSRLLLSLTHSHSGQELHVSVSPTGTLTTSFSSCGHTQLLDCGLTPWNKLFLLTITFTTKQTDLTISASGSSERHRLADVRIHDCSFDSVSIGSREEGFEGEVACAGLFHSVLTATQLQALQQGPSCLTQNNPLCSTEDLVVCIHPAYLLDPERALNLAKAKSLNASQDIFPASSTLSHVLIIHKTHIHDALRCIGGLQVLLPLTYRVRKPGHAKVILNQILEIAVKYCKVPADLESERLISSLCIVLKRVSKRFPLKTSTALLLNQLKDALIWSNKLQKCVIERVLLNSALWLRSKPTVRKLLVTANLSSLYPSDEDRVALISRVIRFSMADIETNLDFFSSAAHIIKTYAEERQEQFYALLGTELLEELVEYTGKEQTQKLLLKLLKYFAKQGYVLPSEKLRCVLVDLLDRDRGEQWSCTKEVLHIVKLTYCSSACDSGSFGSQVLPLLDLYLKPKLTLCEFQALLSLMVYFPTPSQSSASLPELPIKSSFVSAVRDSHEVIIKHPQVMDLITVRLSSSQAQEALADLIRVAQCSPQVLFAQDSFPDWALLRTEAPAGKLVIVCFAQAISKLEKIGKKCAQLFDRLKTYPGSMQLVKAIFEVVSVQETTPFTRQNILHFCYALEDFSRNNGLSVEVVATCIQTLNKMKLLADSKPGIPAMGVAEALERCRYEATRGKFDPREGGVLRIAVTLLFQSICTANQSDLNTLLPLLRLFLRPLTDKQRSLFITNSSKEDIFSNPDFMSRLIFAELSHTLLQRRDEAEVVQTLVTALQDLHSYCGLVAPLERLVQQLTMEDQYDVQQFMLKYGPVCLSSPASPLVSAGWWETDTFDILRCKLRDKVALVLRPAFDTGNVASVVLNEDWVQSIHPFCLISSSSLVACVACTTTIQEIEDKKRPLSQSLQAMPDITKEIHRIARKRAYRLQDEEHEYLYERCQWKLFYKHQTREAGLWSHVQLPEPVWKLDPELDLEYKHTRIKVMSTRKRQYYESKAHKSTRTQIASVTAKRRFSREGTQPPAHSRTGVTQTMVNAVSAEDVLKLVLAKTDSYPPPTPTTQATTDSKQMPKGVRECERIQVKGASFGWLQLTQKYLIFTSARTYKGDSIDYFGSAPVRVDIGMEPNNEEKAGFSTTGRLIRSLPATVQSEIYSSGGVQSTRPSLLLQPVW